MLKKIQQSIALFCTALAWFVPAQLSAMDDAEESALFSGALDAYISYALEHNPGIEAAEHRARAQRNRASAVFSLDDPMLMTRFGGEDFGFSGIGIRQMVMFPTKIFTQRRAAMHMADAAAFGVSLRRAEVVSAVIAAYADLYTALRRKEIMENTTALLRLLEDSVRVMYAAKKATMSELLRIQVELASMEDAVRSVEAEIDSYRHHFAAVLNIDDVDAVQVHPDTRPGTALHKSDAHILAVILEHNPMLAMMESETASASAMVSLARQQYLPDFEISAEYMPGNSSVSIGLGFRLPIWVRRNQARIAEARNTRTAAEMQLAEQRNRIRAEAVSLLNDYRDALRRMELYSGTLIPQAGDVVELTQIDYRTGLAGIADLIESQRMLFSLEERLIGYELKVQKARAGLLLMMGGT